MLVKNEFLSNIIFVALTIVIFRLAVYFGLPLIYSIVFTFIFISVSGIYFWIKSKPPKSDQ
jgi:hypothetical protein